MALNNFLYFFRTKQTFAATRPSAVLIEQLAVCVVKGEPVLLVGETGTGKTSTVQYLAHITGKCNVDTNLCKSYLRNKTQKQVDMLSVSFLRTPSEGYQHEPTKWHRRSARGVSYWLQLGLFCTTNWQFHLLVQALLCCQRIVSDADQFHSFLRYL